MTGLFSRQSNPFLLLGLKQAALLWGGLLVLALVDFQWAIRPLFWAIRCLAGPIVVIFFKLLGATPLRYEIPVALCLGVVVLLLYWGVMGALAAKMAHKAKAMKPGRAIFIYLCSMVFVGGLLTYLVLEERYEHPGGPYVNAIVNNLRQLEGAKDQYAIEKKLRPGDIVTEEDLAPYLRKREDGQLVPRCGTEKYVLNPIGTDAYAICEAEWWEPKRAWERRFVGAKGTIYTLTGIVDSVSHDSNH